MRVIADECEEELLKVAKLIFGINYEVSLFLYKSNDFDLSLKEVLQKLISKDVKIDEIKPSTSELANNRIIELILYKGCDSAHPYDIDSKRSELIELMDKVFLKMDLANAIYISEFYLTDGLPGYPVFWDFAFDIHTKNSRYIFIGSCSD